MKHALALVASALTLSLAAPAAAQDAGWWSVPDDAVRSALKRVRGGQELMRAYALCSVKRNPKLVATLLATNNDSNDERGASDRLTSSNGDCLPDGEFTLNGLSVRGALAEAMYWAHHADADTATLVFSAEKGGEKERFGACAAQEQPANVRRLIATAPGSEAEGTAMAALLPNLRACIAKTPFSSMDVPSARALMAEALYRAAEAQR